MYINTVGLIEGIQKTLRKELNNYMNEVIASLKLRELNDTSWDVLQRDLDLQMDVKEFRQTLGSILLSSWMKSRSNEGSITTTTELINRSYFNIEQMARNAILRDIVEEMNDKIQRFFRKQSQTLQIILQARITEKAKRTNHTSVPIIATSHSTQDQRKPPHSEGTQLSSAIMIGSPLPQKENQKKSRKKAKINGENSSKNTITLVDDPVTTQTPTAAQVFKPLAPPPSNQADFKKCVCAVLNTHVTQARKYVQCHQCLLYFHQTCIKMPKNESNSYICGYCTIAQMDLFAQVQDVLVSPHFIKMTPNALAKQFNVKCDQMLQGRQIHFRCLRIDDNHGLDEITWPDLGEILVNGVKVMEYKPLPQNTCLKKRKDNAYQIRERFTYGQNNIVLLRETKPSSNETKVMRISQHSTYMVGIFVVAIYNPDTLLRKLKMDKENLLTLEQGKNLIVKDKKQLTECVDGLQVEKLKVSIACPFSMARIETPARGGLCTHVQCFSLESMVRMTYAQAHRKWRCPVCKKKVFKIILDDYQSYVIQKMKAFKGNDVTFTDNGDIEEQNVKMQATNSDEDSSPPQTKTKNSSKNRREIVIENLEGATPTKKIKTDPIILID